MKTQKQQTQKQQTQKQQTQKQQPLIPVSKWNNYYDFPTVGAIRQLIFYNTNNFVDDVIRRIGKRQYIHVVAFNEWVEKSQGGTNGI